MMVLLKAVGALDHQTSKNDFSLCTHYGIRPKAMGEIRKIRRQLIQIGKLIMGGFLFFYYSHSPHCFSSSFSNMHAKNKHVVYDIYIYRSYW